MKTQTVKAPQLLGADDLETITGGASATGVDVKHMRTQAGVADVATGTGYGIRIWRGTGSVTTRGPVIKPA